MPRPAPRVPTRLLCSWSPRGHAFAATVLVLLRPCGHAPRTAPACAGHAELHPVGSTLPNVTACPRCERKARPEVASHVPTPAPERPAL